MFVQGCHGQGKVRGKRTFFKVREKSGKIFDIVKVSEKSGNSVFLFIVFIDFEMHFLSENTKSMPQSKQSDQHSTSNTCSSCGQWFSCQCFFPNSFFLAERGWKWRENYGWPAEKAKVKVNMDCFSLIKGQWKLSEKSQGIFIFLMSGNPFVR